MKMKKKFFLRHSSIFQTQEKKITLNETGAIISDVKLSEKNTFCSYDSIH